MIKRVLHNLPVTRLLLYLVVFAVEFSVLGEIGARLLFPKATNLVVASKNPRLVYELNREFPGINALGFRGREVDAERLVSPFLIAAIGDSHTYAITVRDTDHAWPSVLESELNGSLPAPGFQVLNLGVPGYNTAQELEVLKSRAVPLRPAIVILQQTINDTPVSNYIWPEHPGMNRLIARSRLLTRLNETFLSMALNRGFYDRLGRLYPDILFFDDGLVGTLSPSPAEIPEHAPHPPRDPALVPPRYHYMLGDQNWRSHIHQFADVCRSQGIAMLATGFIEDEKQRILAEEGFELLTFNEIFENADVAQYGYLVSDTSSHFNEQGNEVIGKALAKALVNKSMLRIQ